VVPLGLFIWFITAFLADGNSFKNYKNKWDQSHHDRSKEKMQTQEEGKQHLE
jgi:hypothetical protein